MFIYKTCNNVLKRYLFTQLDSSKNLDINIKNFVLFLF